MKSTILLLLLIVSYVHAQNNVYSLLESGETKKIRLASKLITSGEQSTFENLNLLAGIIEKEYNNAPSSRIDALSWGCRALGSTGNGKFKPLLQNIFNSKKSHKKLKKYAKKAYLEILSKEKIIAKTAKLNEVKEVDSAKILYLPQINPSLVLIPKSSLNDIERKIFAIAKSEWKAINYIAKQTYTVKISNTELLDALSQFLFEMHQYNLDKEKTNILILISKSLGKSENGRYKSVLQLVANNTTHKNLSDVSKKMSDILPFSNENFVTGSMNFKRILKEFKHN